MEHDPKAKAAILRAVEEQLKSPETVFVQEHFERLIKLGVPDQQAKELIGLTLTIQMWEAHKFERPFDVALYQSRLAKLPDTGWIDEADEEDGIADADDSEG